MDPLATFTYDTFRDRAGETFDVGDAGLRLTLIAVQQAVGAREGGAFSLFFEGPPDPMLEQTTHRVTHDGLGSFELFLVPVARTGAGFEYEAAFN